ncbi:hypothetical protein DT075_05395 [Bacillus licheniformis]|nr:hypothetical protein DT075_05395 [Bacillus licheniformis]
MKSCEEHIETVIDMYVDEEELAPESFIGLSEKQVNGFWTFILNVSYLQYITNQHSLVVQEKREAV